MKLQQERYEREINRWAAKTKFNKESEPRRQALRNREYQRTFAALDLTSRGEMYAVNRATYSEESSELAAERNSNKEFVWPFDLVLRVREYDGTFAALNLTYDIAMYAGNKASTLMMVRLAYPYGGVHCSTCEVEEPPTESRVEEMPAVKSSLPKSLAAEKNGPQSKKCQVPVGFQVPPLMKMAPKQMPIKPQPWKLSGSTKRQRRRGITIHGTES